MKEKINDLNGKELKNNNDIEKKEKEKIVQNKNNKDEKNNDNIIFQDFNIINLTPKNKLMNNGYVYAILQLQDGRLASAGNDGSINIYNNETFNVELIINEHKESIYDLIQLKNEILVSCSYYDKKMNMYQLENNNYKLLSQIDFDIPKKIN